VNLILAENQNAVAFAVNRAMMDGVGWFWMREARRGGKTKSIWDFSRILARKWVL
jgi:hypothetical protein